MNYTERDQSHDKFHRNSFEVSPIDNLDAAQELLLHVWKDQKL